MEMMNLKLFLTILITFLLTTGQVFAANEEFVFTDNTGTDVTVPANVQSMISLAPGITELYFAVCPECEDIKLVGRTEYDNYPEAALEIPSIGGPSTISVEAIVSKSPDVILGTTLTDSASIEQLRDLGYPVIILKFEKIEDVYTAIDLIGKITGQIENADNLKASMQEKIDKISEKSAQIPDDEKKKVMFIVADDPVYAAGADTLQNQFVTLAGGKDIFEDMEGYFIASDEAIVARNPDIIITPNKHVADGDLIKEKLLQKSTINSITAIKEGHICEVDDDTVLRPGSRIVEALEIISACING